MMRTLLQNLWEKGKTAYSSLSRASTRESLLFLLVLLLLPTQLGKHFWPPHAFVMGFRVDYLSPTLYVTDILLVLLFLQWAVRQKRPSIQRVLPYVLVLFYFLLTILPAHSLSAGLYSLLKLAELLFFGWYVSYRLRMLFFQRTVPIIFLITVFAESILAFLQVTARGSLDGWLYFLGERAVSSLTPGAATVVLDGEVFLRPYGTFSHPNVLAGFLLLSLGYLLFQKKAFSFSGGNLLWRTGLIIGSVGLLATLSRAAILLWGICLLSVAAWSLSPWVTKRQPHTFSRKQGGLMLGGVLIVLVLLVPLFGQVVERFSGTTIAEEAFTVRADLTNIAWQIIQDDPVLGVGLGNFLYASAPLKDPSTPLFFAVQPVHNIFLLTWAETGILGLFIMLWFLARTLLRTNLSGRILLSIVIVLGLFDHYFLTLQQGQLLLAFVLGYCWADTHAS